MPAAGRRRRKTPKAMETRPATQSGHSWWPVSRLNETAVAISTPPVTKHRMAASTSTPTRKAAGRVKARTPTAMLTTPSSR
jgi:hypothetical protein